MEKREDLLASARKDLLSKSSSAQKRGVLKVEELLEAGDARAKYIVATWKLHGAFGYKIDLPAARALLEEASEALVPEACYDLAVFIETNGDGKNRKREAFGFYLLAATLGDKDAREELARCLYWGIGVYKNERIASLLQDSEDKRAERLP